MAAGRLFIISAPSGCGKTTILRQVMADLPALSFSVSHTTRQPRAGENDGTDYYFVDRNRFTEMRTQGKFLEWAEVHGNLYGTSLGSVTDTLGSGTDVILDIDVQGARQVREHKELEPVSIFIAPPSMDELKKRLTGRSTDSQETIALRLENAAREMADAPSYDHLIINDDLAEAVVMVKAVILAERSRSRRAMSGNTLSDITYTS